MNPNLAANLRQVLAELYSDADSIRRIVGDVGVQEARIAFSSPAINIWGSVWREIAKRDKIAILLATVAGEYPDNQEFQKAYNAYQQAVENTSRQTQDSRPKRGASKRRARRVQVSLSKENAADMTNPFKIRFDYYRERSGHAHGELADKLGVVTSALSHWLSGRTPFPPDMWQRAVELMGLSEDEEQELLDLARELRRLPQHDKTQKATNNVWGPDVPLERPQPSPHFVGRQQEITDVLQDLQPGHIVTLWGPGGIGKTQIAAKVIEQLTPNDGPPDRFRDGIVYYSFYDENTNATESALAHIITSFGGELKHPLDDTARLVLEKRCALLVLDGAERADNLMRILKLRGKRCGVLITSQDYQDVYEYPVEVERLPFDDADRLLQVLGGSYAGTENDREQAYELVEGVTLAVYLIGAYLRSPQREPLQEYCQWLRKRRLEALDFGEHEWNSMQVVIKRSLSRLKSKAQQILAVMGILSYQSITLPVLAEALGITTLDLRRPLRELMNYGLVIRVEKSYKLTHILLYDYVKQYLPAPEGIPLQLAAYYTTFIKKQRELGFEGYKSLDVERTHIMAVLTHCVIQKQWKTIIRLVASIQDYLYLRGYWVDRVAILEMVLDTFRALQDRQMEGTTSGFLGAAYDSLGQYQQAIDYYKKAISIAQEIGDRWEESNWLGELSEVYGRLGHQQAVDYKVAVISIFGETDDKWDEVSRLRRLGMAYAKLGQMEEAISFLQRALDNAQTTDDRQGQQACLFSLGEKYNFLGQYQRAIDYYERALGIAQESGDRLGHVKCLGYLGQVYYSLEQYQRAIDYYERALGIAQESGDRQSEGGLRNALGVACYSLGQIEKAIDSHQQAISILGEIGDRRRQSIALRCLGDTYSRLGQVEHMSSYYQQAISILGEIGDPINQGMHLGHLGHTYNSLGEYQKAIECYKQALAIFQDMNYPSIEVICSVSLGEGYLRLGYLTEAANIYQRVVELLPHRALQAHVDLGIIALCQNKGAEAQSHFDAALGVAEKKSQYGTQFATEFNYKAIAHLGLGQKEQALVTLQEALAQPDSFDKIDFFRYELLATVPQPPSGVADMLRLLKESQQKSELE